MTLPSSTRTSQLAAFGCVCRCRGGTAAPWPRRQERGPPVPHGARGSVPLAARAGGGSPYPLESGLRSGRACAACGQPARSHEFLLPPGLQNFDTRQDACWGQLRDEAVCSPSKAHTRQIGGERGWWWVRRGEREGTGDAHRLTSALPLKCPPFRGAYLSPTRFRSRRQSPISLCQAMCRSLVRPSDLDAQSRAPHRSWGALALTAGAHPRSPPTHPPFCL